MHPGTEDLLSIRDDEPVDAAARAAVDADPALRAEVARLRDTRDRLRELPDLVPPADVRAKVFAELGNGLRSGSGTGDATPRQPYQPLRAGEGMHSIASTVDGYRQSHAGAGQTADSSAASGNFAGARRLRLRRVRRTRWPLGGAIAAAVALIAVLGVRSMNQPGLTSPDQLGLPGPGTIIVEGPVAADNIPDPGLAMATHASLTSESARLERLLNEIPYRPRLVNAGTATTISGLEQRIGQVDQVLLYSSANGLQPEYAEALWRERVDLMNALLQVRYAQARRFGF